MNKLIILGLALVAGPAFAAGSDPFTMPAVPEIDALAGAAALAVVGGVVALVRERTKR